MVTQIKFKPWTGDDYDHALFGKRILVLGESHYGWVTGTPLDHCATFTIEQIANQLDGRHPTKAFWTKIAGTFLNTYRPTPEEKCKFWRSVSFYNYVQQSPGEKSRISPTADMFKASEPAFFEVLDLLKPEIVIVLGFRLWEKLPKQRPEDEMLETEAGRILTRHYSYPGGTCRAYAIKHPSSGFNSCKWHPHVMAFVRSNLAT
jgi:hypothetical protein